MATRWLTPAQAAERLGVSESTIWRFLRREQLPSVKVGGRRRIPAAAVGRVVRSARPVARPEDIAPLTLDDALFALAGRFRSDGRGPGAEDKHRYLGAKR
jgi:excisionase family DNA binding protein